MSSTVGSWGWYCYSLDQCCPAAAGEYLQREGGSVGSRGEVWGQRSRTCTAWLVCLHNKINTSWKDLRGCPEGGGWWVGVATTLSVAYGGAATEACSLVDTLSKSPPLKAQIPVAILCQPTCKPPYNTLRRCF